MKTTYKTAYERDSDFANNGYSFFGDAAIKIVGFAGGGELALLADFSSRLTWSLRLIHEASVRVIFMVNDTRHTFIPNANYDSLHDLEQGVIASAVAMSGAFDKVK